MKQVLSVEQMKHLQELGLDTGDASMCWCRAISHKSVTWELEIYEYVINQKLDSNFWETTPTYTLQDILDKLPTLIIISSEKSENIIDVAYDMLCWCIENGYIKKEVE